MITIYGKTATAFDTLGMGTLFPSSCFVSEELNGMFELEMVLPYDDKGKWKHRFERLEERQDNLEELTRAFSVMQNEQEHIKTDVGEIKEDVKQLVSKPAKRWDGMIDKAIAIFVGAVLTFILCNVGM